MKKIQSMNSNEIAEVLHSLAFDWASRVNNGLPDGVHRRTFVSVVRELSEALQWKAENQDQEFDDLAFLDASGFFEVANHESMEDYAYCTKREDYVDNE
jgi:hypothetical protein